MCVCVCVCVCERERDERTRSESASESKLKEYIPQEDEDGGELALLHVRDGATMRLHT